MNGDAVSSQALQGVRPSAAEGKIQDFHQADRVHEHEHNVAAGLQQGSECIGVARRDPRCSSGRQNSRRSDRIPPGSSIVVSSSIAMRRKVIPEPLGERSAFRRAMASIASELSVARTSSPCPGEPEGILPGPAVEFKHPAPGPHEPLQIAVDNASLPAAQRSIGECRIVLRRHGIERSIIVGRTDHGGS